MHSGWLRLFLGQCIVDLLGIIFIIWCIFFLLYSQVLPTRLWDCLSWTLTTQQKLLRLLFQPHLAQGNEMSSVILLNLKNQKHTGACGECHPLFSFSLALSEHYLASVTWVTDDRIAVQWLKRLQNDLLLQIYRLNGAAWDEVEVKHNVLLFHIRISMTWNIPLAEKLYKRLLSTQAISTAIKPSCSNIFYWWGC